MSAPSAAWLRQRIRAEQAWMDRHGGTLEGYVARYGPAAAPKIGMGGEHAYNADLTELRRYQAALTEMEAAR